MAWRDDLGKGKYKTGARKSKSKFPKILLALVILTGAVYLLFHFNIIKLPQFLNNDVRTTSGTILSVVEIVEKVSASVVEITTEMNAGASYEETLVSKGAGSGVVISSDGYIVTNNHVIDGANEIFVRLSNGESYNAVLVGGDASTDLAVIKIEAKNLIAATYGNSSSLRTGELAVAIGNPLGRFGGTVTDGIISAVNREVTIDGEIMTLLQTNAAVNPGNSGGGLFNSYGELIGIIIAKTIDGEGLGFAIPIDTVKRVIAVLIGNK